MQTAKERFLSAPDSALREVKTPHIEAIAKSFELLNRRVMNKSERMREADVFKLSVTRMCLGSSFMALRIQGIRDLN